MSLLIKDSPLKRELPNRTQKSALLGVKLMTCVFIDKRLSSQDSTEMKKNLLSREFLERAPKSIQESALLGFKVLIRVFVDTCKRLCSQKRLSREPSSL